MKPQQTSNLLELHLIFFISITLQELSQLEQQKLANLQRLTEAIRSELAEYWEKCYYSADQRGQFVPAYDENYTEELLEEHEEELQRMKVSTKGHDLYNCENYRILYQYCRQVCSVYHFAMSMHEKV